MDAVFGDAPAWRAPLQLFAGLHYLVLRGQASWDDVGTALAEHGDFLRERVAAHGVQTNELQRSWMLLPCFLEVVARTGARELDLVELGASGGLNLLWDHFRYRYVEGTWGRHDACLELEGSERHAVPGDVLSPSPRVQSRVGIDVDPVDLTTDEGVAFVKSFVWADQTWRLDLLDRAVDAFRADPPRIVRGNLVDELPGVLARRDDEALMLVWQIAVFGYLTADERREARNSLAHAGAEGPLALVEASRPADGADDYYGLRIQVWPGGERVELAHGDWHGAWLDWLGAAAR